MLAHERRYFLNEGYNDMKALAKYAGIALSVGIVGCGGSDGGGDAIDQGLLAQYRAAVPSETQIMASSPKASSGAKIGDPALYPSGSAEIVLGINGSIEYILASLELLVSIEPTVYNSDTKEFFWGPYKNENGFGTIAAYIRDAGEGQDFRYHYAILRGKDNDVAGLVPILWGGANPDPDAKDHGSGITLIDFEANAAFEQANNPNGANMPMDRGRFVAVYGKDATDKGDLTLVFAALRGFVSKDNPDVMPADLDYLYGRHDDGTNKVDFVDWKSTFDVHEDAAMAKPEDVGVRLAFVNEGQGRAEAQASGGDLASGQVADAIECWDNALAQSYLSFKTSTNGTEDSAASEGDLASCGLFQASLSELGVPALADVPADFKAALDDLAKNGAPKE